MIKHLNSLFFVVFALEIVAEVLRAEWLIFIVKPAVTSLLIYLYKKEAQAFKSPFANAVYYGLLFSLGGDILLMFPRFNPNFFLLGLGSFLIAHICYIVAFVGNIRATKVSNSFTLKAMAFNPFLLLTLSMFGIIKNHLGEMQIPVIAYMIAITTMGISATLRINHTSSKSWKLIFAGAFLFTISDSLIALNKFVVAFPKAPVAIMITYYLAQYLIVTGALEHLRQEKKSVNL